MGVLELMVFFFSLSKLRGRVCFKSWAIPPEDVGKRGISLPIQGLNLFSDVSRDVVHSAS